MDGNAEHPVHQRASMAAGGTGAAKVRNTYMNSDVSGRSGSSSLTLPWTAKKASYFSGVYNQVEREALEGQGGSEVAILDFLGQIQNYLLPVFVQFLDLGVEANCVKLDSVCHLFALFSLFCFYKIERVLCFRFKSN